MPPRPVQQVGYDWRLRELMATRGPADPGAPRPRRVSLKPPAK
jgi:hypothetical protein